MCFDKEKNGYVGRGQLLYTVLMLGVTDLPSSQGHVGTRTNQGSSIDYITENPDLHHQLGMRRGLILGY